MKHHRNRSKSKRQLWQAVLWKWKYKRYIFSQISVAALLSAMPVSWAEEDASAVSMPEVVVSGRQDKGSYKTESVSSVKYSEPLRDIPQTITVVPEKVMQEQAATSLREVLRNVPGISIQAGEGGTPAGDQMTIRGFSARTDMFIDGVRDFGGYSRDPFNTQHIEVSKGPASAYSGRGSTGGSINMVSKEANLERDYSGTIGLGTDMYQRYTIDLNEPLQAIPGAAVRVNAMYHTNEVANRDVIENERWGVAPSIAFGLGTPTRLTLDYFHMEQNNMPDYGIPFVAGPTNTVFPGYIDQPAPVDWSNFYGLNGRDYEDIKTDIVTARIEHDFSDELSLRNQTRYGLTLRDSIVTAPRFLDLDTVTTGTQGAGQITRTDWKSRDQVTEMLNNQTDFTIKFNTAAVEHTLVPGFEITREQDRNYTRAKTGPDSPSTNVFDPSPDDPYLENIQRNGARLQATVNSIGVYAFDTLKFNEHWELNGGLRYDYFNVDYVSINTNGSYASNLGHIDRTLSWRSGLVYKPVEEGSIYFGYGSSFNPSAEGLATTTITNTATATSNINLDPEKTETFELGTKWDLLEKKLGLAMAVFHTVKSNARTEDPAVPGDIAVLEGKQVVDGIELGVNGNVTDDWSIFAGYTFLVGRVDESNNPLEVGNEMSNTPSNSFNVWTTYQLPFNFEAGAGAQYVASRYTSNANTRLAPEYWTASAMLAYKVNENITMRLNLINVADTEYIESVGGGHFIPGAGRTATVTTEFKF